MSEWIVTRKSEGVLEIEIRRSQTNNALDGPMYTAAAEAVLSGEADPEVRVLLLRGQDDLFISGTDLQDIALLPSNGISDLDSGPPLAFTQALGETTKPVVAAIKGLAIGVGTILLLYGDVVYASADAQFQLHLVAPGLCPDFSSSLLLPQCEGRQATAEMFMLSRPFGAALAHAYGLVSYLVERGEVDALALERARSLAASQAAAP